MTEMDKLVEYLDKSGANYIDLWGKQVVVYDDEGSFKWDAICQYGSYGYKEGLLEITGDIVDEKKDGDSVAGWLTAEDVIKRVEAQSSGKKCRRRSTKGKVST